MFTGYVFWKTSWKVLLHGIDAVGREDTKRKITWRGACRTPSATLSELPNIGQSRESENDGKEMEQRVYQHDHARGTDW